MGGSLGKSHSMDNSRLNGSAKPRHLPTSLSESALKGLQGVKASTLKDGLRRSGSGKSLSTMGEENSSHEESTDSTSIGGLAQDLAKKKKKKKLFTRLLKSNSDKKSS